MYSLLDSNFDLVYRYVFGLEYVAHRLAQYPRKKFEESKNYVL